MTETPTFQVAHFRQVLFCPLRLMHQGNDDAHVRLWEVLQAMGDTCPWHEVDDEYTGSADQFHERHYNEFVTFLPYVQQFMYGEGRAAQGHGSRTSESPMRVFRRNDVRQARKVLRPDEALLLLDIVHVDLYFFLDVDLLLLNVKVSTNQLSLTQARELMYRFGRGYPAGWQAMHCQAMVWRNGADRHQ